MPNVPALHGCFVKGFKIPKEKSESYNEDKQTTQWSKEQITKGQTTIYKTYT